MPCFRKYAFANQNEADSILALCTGTTVAVPLGVLVGSLISYDILWEGDAPAEATKYETWPTPCGVHSFLGWDEQYTNDYNQHQSL